MARPQSVVRRSTLEYVALHARRRPGQVALIWEAGEATYATLHRELVAVTVAMSRLNLPAGAVVALAHPEIRPRLLVTLACERLKLVVAAFRTEEGSGAESVTSHADLVISPVVVPPDCCKRFLHLTDAWMAAALSEAPGGSGHAPAWPELSPDDPVLLLRSSGSTGRPKRMVVTRAMLASRLAGRVEKGFHHDSRLLAIMEFTMASMLYNCVVCLRLGATVIGLSSGSVVEALPRWQPTQLHMLPFHLSELLSSDRPMVKLPGLTLVTGGAPLSADLRRRALERLCGRIMFTYGSNETSTICSFDEDGSGLPVRGVSVAIVDAQGARLPPDSVGEICVRGASVIKGYYGEPETAHDGWWRTRDFGRLDARGRLTLLGRGEDLLRHGIAGAPAVSDGVLNFGGLKRAMVDVEAEIQALAGCDVALLVARDATGDTCAAVCAVTDMGEAARLAARIRATVAGRFVVYAVSAIPRTPEGKLRRAELGAVLAGRAPVRPSQAA